MITIIVYPKDIRVKKYFKYFLFLRSNDSNYNKAHVSYPNTNHCLGLFKGSKLLVESIELIFKPHSGFHSYLTGIYQKPLNFYYKGPFDEVCIDFEPLGLDLMTKQKLSISKFENRVIESALDKSWKAIYLDAFKSKDINQRAQQLEHLFLLEHIYRHLYKNRF